jgi:hypothetical protein
MPLHVHDTHIMLMLAHVLYSLSTPNNLLFNCQRICVTVKAGPSGNRRWHTSGGGHTGITASTSTQLQYLATYRWNFSDEILFISEMI